MKIAMLSHFIRGWFIGNFEPSLYKTNEVEVGYRTFKSNDTEQKHFHKIATEINLVTKGVILMNGVVFRQGSIVTLEPNEVANFRVIEDTEMVVVKLPGANNDKYIV